MDAKTLCMGVLMLGDASGYEIKKQFEEGPFAHFHAAGFGSIYPALNQLLAEGRGTCTTEIQEGRPSKKVYSLTEAGREAFARSLHREPAPDTYRSESVFMMFFADQLDAAHLARVYDGYLEAYRAHAERMASWDVDGRAKGRQFVHGLGLAIYQTTIEFMEANRGTLLTESREPAQAAE